MSLCVHYFDKQLYLHIHTNDMSHFVLCTNIFQQQHHYVAQDPLTLHHNALQRIYGRQAYQWHIVDNLFCINQKNMIIRDMIHKEYINTIYFNAKTMWVRSFFIRGTLVTRISIINFFLSLSVFKTSTCIIFFSHIFIEKRQEISSEIEKWSRNLLWRHDFD